MEESTEIEERVDLDEECSEDMDDDVDDQIQIQIHEDNSKGLNDAESIDRERDDESGAVDSDNRKSKQKIRNPSQDGDEREKRDRILSLPPHGSEVFIGGLPRDASEGDLGSLCDSIGEVQEIRLIKNKDTGGNKGYAFISFKSKEDAQKSVTELNGREVKGKAIRCSFSESKNRLFIGNVPKILTDGDFREVIEGVGPGINNIELIKDPMNNARNRGFAFIEYYNNACADYARQKMSSSGFKLNGNSLTVNWADPRNAPDQSASGQVKSVHVKNIGEKASSEELRQLFERYGEVVRVVLPSSSKSGQVRRDFGFIHYSERASAVKAAENTEKLEIHGQTLEVSLAKPAAEKKLPEGPAVQRRHTYPPPHQPYPPPSQQPVIYGRGPLPPGMQMIPMLLPDGRIGYVLQQQPRIQNERRRETDIGRARRHRPY